MKAMILAAGRGERMRPLTDTCPKPLIKVNNKSLIEYHIIKLAQAGFTDIMINVAWLGAQLVDYLGSGERWHVTLHFSDEKDNALETAGGIANVLDFFEGKPFFVVSGDIYTELDYAKLTPFSEPYLAKLWLVPNPHHHTDGDFAITSDGVLNFTDSAKYTYSGLGWYSPVLFQTIKQPKQALAPILRDAMTRQQVIGEVSYDFWTDVGTPTRLLALQHYLALPKNDE